MAISKEFKVGLLALVTGVVMYFGFNFLKGMDLFASENEYIILYDDIGGLQPSNAVMLNGLQVGRVSKITLLTEKNNKLLVTISLKKELAVGDSTLFSLKSEPLGGTYIVLRMGKNSRLIASSDTIKGFKEETITELLSRKTMPIIENLDSTVASVNLLLSPGFRKDMHGVMNNLNKTTRELNAMVSENRSKMGAVATNLSEMTASMKELEKEMHPILAKLNMFADSLNDLDLKATVRKAYVMLDHVDSLVLKMQSKDGTIGLMLNDKKLYTDMVKTMEDLDKLLLEFDHNPHRFLAPLGKKPKKKDLKNADTTATP